MKFTFALTALLLAPLTALHAADAAMAVKKSAPRRPNVLVILSDDMGYADLGCQGSKDIQTPNIDRLATEGVRCTAGYVTSVMCSPSRAGIMTGRSGSRFGYDINWWREDYTYSPSCSRASGRTIPPRYGRQHSCRHRRLEAKPEDRARFESVTGKRKTYCAMVYALDRAVGRILQQLKDDGLEESTLIFFLSDNGSPVVRRIASSRGCGSNQAVTMCKSISTT